MNVEKCANCLLHNWKQIQDETELQRCKRCKLIKYCGKDCQTEHWQKVHKKQCKYFADPVKAQRWEHKEGNCTICQLEAKVGKAKLERADNPNYECIHKKFKFPLDHYHQHPFPFDGQIGNTYEKAIIVLWQLFHKFQITQPERVVRNYQKVLKTVLDSLTMKRLLIWRNRKIFPSLDIQDIGQFIENFESSNDLFEDISKIVMNGSSSDPFQLWKLIELVNGIIYDANFSKMCLNLKDQLTAVPDEFRPLLSQGMVNSVKYLTVANQVLEALSNQIIPYQDVLMIIGGGRLKQACTFCSGEMIINDVVTLQLTTRPVAIFEPLYMGMFCCDRKNCKNTLQLLMDEKVTRYEPAVFTTATERRSNRCDFCFQLPPTKDVHRCSVCLSTLYCSKDCQLEDWKIHQMVCKEEVEGRKKKCGGSARKIQARDAVVGFTKGLEDSLLEDTSNIELVEKKKQVLQIADKFKVKKH